MMDDDQSPDLRSTGLLKLVTDTNSLAKTGHQAVLANCEGRPGLLVRVARSAPGSPHACRPKRYRDQGQMDDPKPAAATGSG